MAEFPLLPIPAPDPTRRPGGGRGGALDQSIRYGLAVTIRAGEHVPVYQEVRQALAVQVPATGAA